MEEFIQNIKYRKRVGSLLILGFVFAIVAGFFFLTASETWALGKEKLGEERYDARMNDSYQYAAFLLLMAVPMILAMNPFFNSYIKVVKTLSKTAMERLQLQNETAPFFNRYLPGYIAKDKSVVFFKFLKTTEIHFADITKINLTRGSRGGYFLHIKTKSSFFIGLMGEKLPNLILLIDQIKETNASVTVNLP